MSMFRRLLMWVLLAVLGALVATLLLDDPGLVFVRYRGYELERTVPVALITIAAAFFLIWLLAKLLLLPFRAWRGRVRRRSRQRLAGGLAALHEGRWQRAEALLERAADDRGLRAAARLGAARAADARGDPEASVRHLAALAQTEHGAIAVGLFEAERALAAGRAAEAAANLDALAATGPLPPRGLLLRIEALAASRRADEAYGLLGALRNAQALNPDALKALEMRLAAQTLREARDPNVLADTWDALPKPLRGDAAIVAAYAERAAALRMEGAAANAVETALATQWDEDLVRFYGGLSQIAAPTRLATAEAWLRAHSASPALLTVLARLSREAGALGKAEDYLHRALAQGAGAEAWEEFGHVFAAGNDPASAQLSYANALRAARCEPAQPLPGRGLRERIFDEAVEEERDEHGVPRLRG